MNARHGLVERNGIRIALGDAGRHSIVMRGTMSEPDVAQWLQPLLDEVHHAALLDGAHEVTLDIRELAYANAALWKCLVVWLRRIREPRERSYDLRLVMSDTHAWQQIGVSTLRVFGADRLRVDRG